MKRTYILLICVSFILVGVISLMYILIESLVLVPDPNLFVEVKTNKANYKINESVEIQIGGYLGEDKPYIEGGICKIDIFKMHPEEVRLSNMLVFGLILHNNYTVKCPYFENYTKVKNDEGKKFTWKQESCKEFRKVTPGEYNITVSCGYADLRGSSWEGVYHGGLDNYTIIQIE